MVSLNPIPKKWKHKGVPKDNGKIGREAFLYLEGKDGDDKFAQCASCDMWNNKAETCAILGPGFFVDADDSCGLYIKGKPHDQPCDKIYTPEEVGFVDRDVRCENCKYGGDGECSLFKMLNDKFPDEFELDTKIKPYGCCNAQTRKRKE